MRIDHPFVLRKQNKKKSWQQIRIGYGFWTLKIVKLSNVCDTMTRKHRILLNYLVNWAMFSKGNKRVEITIFLSSPVPCNWKGRINRQRVTSSPLLPPSYIPIPNPVSRFFFSVAQCFSVFYRVSILWTYYANIVYILSMTIVACELTSYDIAPMVASGHHFVT